jgi:tetratricopeptide (TPR) repeat protein
MLLRRLSFSILILLISFISKAAVISNAVSPVHYFSGREQELRRIDELFKSGERVVSLVGISGIGKTEIIRQYLASKEKHYAIIWVFESDLDLRPQFQQLAQQINRVYGNGTQLVSDKLSSCIDSVVFFMKGKKDWLIVFDNLRIGENGNIDRFVKGDINGRVIVSSQDKASLRNTIEVSFLDQGASGEMIKKIDGRLGTVCIEEVYKKFLGHPLLLAQCAYFLKDNSPEFLSSMEFEFDEGFAKLVKYIVSTLKDSEVKLLIKAASLDNHLLTKKLMLKIAGGENDLLGLTRVNLLVQRKMDDKDVNFEMHDLIKATLLSILDKKLVKENVKELVDQANSIFPQSEHLYGELMGNYPNLLQNLDYLLTNAERYNIDIYKILELRKNLMISYFYLLDFEQTKKQLDWFEANNKAIITANADRDQLLPAVIFLVGVGHYKHFIEDKVTESINAFEEAIKIVNNKNIRKIKCFVYEEYAQILLSSGEVDLAFEKIQVSQEELSNPEAILDKGMVYYTLGVIYMEKGEYEAALNYIDKSIDERLKFGHSTFSELNYETKSTMLLHQGRYKEAFEISKASLERIDGYFDKDHDLKNRALIFLAWSEIGLGKLKDAEKHISKAKTFFHKTEKGDTERNGGEYLAYISIVEGEIARYQKDYAKAVEKCMEARKNLRKIYRNLKNDLYGFILERIVAASALAQQNAHKAHYLTEYEKIFGKTNDRAIRMRSL